MTRWNFLRTSPQLSDKESTQPLSLSPEPANLDYRYSGWVREAAVTDLRTWAFRYAGQGNGRPEILQTLIGWLYNNKVTVQDAHTQREQERISELAEEAARKQTQVDDALHRQASLRDQISEKRRAIDSKRSELEAIRAGDPRTVDARSLSDTLSVYIAGAILVFVTLYLFLFYVSAIYNAFLFDAAKAAQEGLQAGRELSVTIFNGQAFQKAWSSGLMTFAFLATAPSVVMGLGYLLHHFWKRRQWLLISALGAITFFFDFLIAYEIVYQIHKIRILTGETEIPWRISTLLQSAEFYIILIAGFVVYLMWGIILQVVLEGIEKFHPARAAARTLGHSITELGKDAARLDAELREVGATVVSLEGELKVLRQKQSPRELHNNIFRRHLDELMHGWLTYIATAFPEEQEAKAAEARRVCDTTVATLTA